jgi:hypothetical protein
MIEGEKAEMIEAWLRIIAEWQAALEEFGLPKNSGMWEA